VKTSFWFGLALSVFLVGFILYTVDLSALGDAFAQADFKLVLAAVPPILLTHLIRAWRWKLLLSGMKQIPVWTLTSATTIGAMTDMVLPARGGDLVRAWLIGRKEEVSKLACFATLLVEKVMDVGTILLVAIPVLILFPFPHEHSALLGSLRVIVVLGSVLCIGTLAAVFLAGSPTPFIRQLLNRIRLTLPERVQERGTRWGANFASGLVSVRESKHGTAAAFLSMLLWSSFALSNFLILEAFNLGLPAYAAFVLLIFQVLGVTLPSSPGFIGTYHGAVIGGLLLFGINTSVATSVAISMHAAFFIPFILAGLGFLWVEGLSFRNLQSAGSRNRSD